MEEGGGECWAQVLVPFGQSQAGAGSRADAPDAALVRSYPASVLTAGSFTGADTVKSANQILWLEAQADRSDTSHSQFFACANKIKNPESLTAHTLWNRPPGWGPQAWLCPADPGGSCRLV